MSKHTFLALYIIFTVSGFPFLLLWLFQVLVPFVISLVNGLFTPHSVFGLFFNVYFIMMLCLFIPASVFESKYKELRRLEAQGVNASGTTGTKVTTGAAGVQVVVKPTVQQQVQYTTQVEALPPVKSKEQSRPEPEDTMYCIHCGAKIVAASKFCFRCGKEQE